MSSRLLIRDLRMLSLASRLKHLSDRMSEGVLQLYKENGIELNPRWFLVFYQLSIQSPLSGKAISELTGQTNETTNQLLAELSEAGLIHIQDKYENISLSTKGEELSLKIHPVWNSIELATTDWANASGYDILTIISKLEEKLDEKGIYERSVEFRR